ALSAVCSGTGTTIELTGQSGGIVKWQASTDGGSSWSDIVSTDSSLDSGAVTQTTLFRAIVQSGVCAAATSSVASVTIAVPPAITTDLTNQTVCVGTEVTWSLVAGGSGLSYQWQRDGTNLVEGVGNFIGTTSSTLTNIAIASGDSLPEAQGYLCVVTGTCT